jgi:hypothetical protein
MVNPNFWYIFGGTFLVMCIIKLPSERLGISFFRKCLPEKKFPLGSPLREGKAVLLGERVVRITIGSIYLIVLYKILLQDDCDFLDVRAGGRAEKALYFRNFPC